MFSLEPTWERVSKGRPQADCVSESPLLSKEWANSAKPLSCLTTPRNKPGLGAPFRSKSKPWEQETPALGDWSPGKPHENRRQLVFRWSKGCREKPYSVVLIKIHSNVTFIFVPLMSFLTQRLCNMLDSQALAFNTTFDKSSIHFFSTNIYWTNSARCQGHKDDYLSGLPLEGIEDKTHLLHLQTTSSFQSTSYTSSNLILGTSLECVDKARAAWARTERQETLDERCPQCWGGTIFDITSLLCTEETRVLRACALWAPRHRLSGDEELFGRVSKLAFKEIFASENTLFRKKIDFTFKEDCKEAIFKAMASGGRKNTDRSFRSLIAGPSL